MNIPFELKKSSIFHRIADITDTDLLFPGTILVSPKFPIPDATVELKWTLLNLTKNIKIEDGTGTKTFYNLEPGLYSLEYKPIQGYITPMISVKNLGERQTIVFDGAYEEGTTGTGENTGTVNVFMNLILGGWRVEMLDDNNNVLYSIPEQGYSHLLEYSQSGLPLGKYRIVIQELNTPILSPSEIERTKYLTSESNVIDWTVTYDNPTQFQTTLDVNSNNSAVRWELDAKYREDDPIIGIGSIQQLPIFVAEQNEAWRFKITDTAKQFERYIVRVHGSNLPYSDVLYRNNQTNEYYYGYDSDMLLFNMSYTNTMYVNVKNTENVIIPNMRFTFEGKNYLNSHGYSNFMQIFNPFKNTNSFYDGVSFSVKRFWNPEDVNPSNSLTVNSKKTNYVTFNTYVPDPLGVTDYFNIGFFKIKTNKTSTISLFYIELDSNGDPIKLTTAYSDRGTETPIIVIDIDSNFVPVIDISA